MRYIIIVSGISFSLLSLSVVRPHADRKVSLRLHALLCCLVLRMLCQSTELGVLGCAEGKQECCVLLGIRQPRNHKIRPSGVAEKL